MNIKNKKIELLTKRLEEATGKKVVLKEENNYSGITEQVFKEILTKLDKHDDEVKKQVLIRLKNYITGWLSTHNKLKQ